MFLFDICPLVAAKVRFATRKSEKIVHNSRKFRIFGFTEDTIARKSKRKTCFSFAFRSLIRIFAPSL